MRYPCNLKKSIGFIAPSFGCTTEPYKTRLESAVSKLSKEYTVDVYDNCFKSEVSIRSNTEESCAKEFIDAYKSNNDVVISVGGGEFMVDILNHIDFNEISKLDPKWFMGFSDNTNLTYLLPILCDVATIYGPCGPEFGMNEYHKSISESLEILKGNLNTVSKYGMYEIDSTDRKINALNSYNLTEVSKTICIPSTCEFSGRLIGGCLDIVLGLVGTKFDKVSQYLEKYKEDGFIWFLEACDLNPLQIRRAMRQLDNAGYFKYIKGFIIGRPMHINEEIMGVTHVNAVTDIISKYNVPMILDADLGHLKPSMPIICGSVGTVLVKESNYVLKMERK